MIQDIAPSKLHNEYHKCCPEAGDTLFVFDAEGNIYARVGDDATAFPKYDGSSKDECIYLFSVDEKKFFLLMINSDRAPF